MATAQSVVKKRATRKAKETKPELQKVQVLVDTMVIADASCCLDEVEELEERYDELGDELFAEMDAYELKPFNAEWQNHAVEGYISHAFTLELPFQVNCRTPAENLDLIFDHLEEWLVDLIDGAELDPLEVWVLKHGKPHLWLNGLRMLDEGQTEEAVAEQDELTRQRLLGGYRPAKKRKRKVA